MVYYKEDKKLERKGQCPYCYDGELDFDNYSKSIYCEKCLYAIDLDIKKWLK